MKRSLLTASAIVIFEFGTILAGCAAAGHSPAKLSKYLVLANRTNQWAAGIDGQLGADLLAAGTNAFPALVKFYHPLTLAEHQLLYVSGVRLEEYLADTSYLALLPWHAIFANNAVSNLIYSARPFLPQDKLRLPAHIQQFAGWSYDSQNKQLKLLVGFWRSIGAL